MAQGRILTMLMGRGRVTPVPMLRRLPKGLKPTPAGQWGLPELEQCRRIIG